MRQTLAIFYDAYRELNSRRMFWITLVLSILLIVVLAMFGVDARGIRFLKWRFDQPHADAVYKAVLIKVLLIDVWLTWGAAILALISTAGIFPDFLAGGSIDLYLSKPIGRFRLFLTKYAAGLLFATLQVTVFAVGMFLVVGVRLGQWMPSLLLAIPIVVCFFSYLYAVCVLVGVVTRSTVAAALLTLLAWVMFWGATKTESDVLMWSYAQQYRVSRFERRVAEDERQLKELEANPSITNAFGLRTTSLKSDEEKYRRLAADARQADATLARFHRLAYVTLTVLPKTGPTIDLLDRHLIRDREVDALSGGEDDDANAPPGAPRFGNADESVLYDLPAQMVGERKRRHALRIRPLSWVLGTSLGFEAVIFVWGAWVFCRRDY
jgi:hypothetical protein